MKVTLPLIVLAMAFLSFNFNFYRITWDSTLYKHDMGSEQLVLDGMLNAAANEGPVVLGRYTRPEIDQQWPHARELYQDENRTGEFYHYTSQLGLQVKFFSALDERFGFPLEVLSSMTAFFMSVVVMLFFIGIRRLYSTAHAAAFCVPLVFSPWPVVFSRHLYWVEFTWFVPALVSLFFARRALVSPGGLIMFGGGLFCAFTIRFLCGYEYITTITLAAMVPLTMVWARSTAGLRNLILSMGVCGVASVSAFVLSVGIHARSLGPSLTDGLGQIATVARKRTISELPAETIEDICSQGEKENRNKCEYELETSLVRNPVVVVARYFMMPRAFPWVEHVRHHPEDLRRLRELRTNLSLPAVIETARTISPASYARLGLRALETLFLPVLTLTCLGYALRRRDRLSAAFVMSLIAPVSWYILAKGHSDVHYYLNHVLWYLLFVPFAFMFLLDSVIGRHHWVTKEAPGLRTHSQ